MKIRNLETNELVEINETYDDFSEVMDTLMDGFIFIPINERNDETEYDIDTIFYNEETEEYLATTESIELWSNYAKKDAEYHSKYLNLMCDNPDWASEILEYRESFTYTHIEEHEVYEQLFEKFKHLIKND